MKSINLNPFALCLQVGIAGLIACQPGTEKTDKHKPMSVQVKAPQAKVVPHPLTAHGQNRTDNYYWLRDRENPEVIAYLEAENKYLDTMLSHTRPLQEKLFNEMKGRVKEKDQSAPVKDGNYYYYYRYDEGFEYPVHCRKKGSLDAPEEIMLNVNDMAKGHDYYNVAGLEVSDDEQVLAYADDTVSRRLYTLRFKNLTTGALYPETITDVDPGFAWAQDNKTIFYVKKDITTLLPYQVYKHVLGTDPQNDQMVYEEKDDTFYTSVFRTKSKKYIMLFMGSTLSSEMRYLDAAQPGGSFKVVLPREKEHEYSASHLGDKFYIRTNWKAQNFRLMEVPVAQSANKNAWKEVIAHREEVYLDDFELFRNHLVLSERKEGLLHLRVIRWHDRSEHFLDFGEPAYLAYAEANPEMDTRYSAMGILPLPHPVQYMNMIWRLKRRNYSNARKYREGLMLKIMYQKEYMLWQGTV
jgi:oligopeptidase B